MTEELQKRIEELTDKQERLSISVNNFKAEAEGLEDKIKNLSTVLADKLESNTETIKKSALEIQVLKSANAVDLRNMEKEKEYRKNEIDIIYDKIGNKQEILVEIKNEIIKARMLLDGIKKEAKREEFNLRKLKESNMEEANQYGVEIAKKKSQVEKLNTEITSKNAEVIEVLESIELIKKEEKALISDIQSLSNEKENTKSIINLKKDLDDKIDVLKSDIEHLEKTKDNLVEEVKSLNDNNSKVKEDIKELNINKITVQQKELELEQRVEYIKGVYSDFKLPW